MATVFEHYERHLAPVYSWMAGGIESAVSDGRQELTALGLSSNSGKCAVDLGAGFGMHAIPLAQSGWKVLAIDSSAHLLSELGAQTEGMPVTAVQDDLLSFTRHLSDTPELFLCMGDTLTHLADLAAVEGLIHAVAEHLVPGGRFIASFRDYTVTLDGEARFIPVKSDACRILTCFLEYAPDAVRVHDILHEREDGAWLMRVSAYQKLRLDPLWLKARLEKHGFAARTEAGLSGMVRLVATRSPGI